MNEKTLEQARDMIAGFLKNRRIELGLSQQDLADRTGMARATINRMEQGLFWLGMKQYLLICEALHLFPAIAEMEADDTLANALRQNWTAKPKAMSIEDALKLKDKRHKRPDQHN
jgi:transcriptional regulator with XRE-family HTH domain